ncbi:MAG TPA: hypothetical protein VLU96_06135, partial [Gaiellaceae bacterium]|nr:hypothetical protein [Gaiellaceae bacterium]
MKPKRRLDGRLLFFLLLGLALVTGAAAFRGGVSAGHSSGASSQPLSNVAGGSHGKRPKLGRRGPTGPAGPRGRGGARGERGLHGTDGLNGQAGPQ